VIWLIVASSTHTYRNMTFGEFKRLVDERRKVGA
jgi:hypothetical protein